MRIRLLIILSFILTSFLGISQDVEQSFRDLKSRLTEDPLRVNGSLSVMGQFYDAFGIDNRALPFTGRINGALNFDLLGIKMPLSIALSNGGVVFNKRLPSYNFIGISPEYKWAKVHIGTRSLDYGKYSFSNHAFQGLGFELTPGKWYASAFYGRLRRARVQDFNGFQNIEPFFKRMGTGIKGGYEDGKDKFLISFFKAWDDETSVVVPDSAFNFFAGENFISSIELSKGISKHLSIEVNASKSSFSENKTLPEYTEKVRLSNYFGLFQRNVSTRDNNAFEVKLNYSHRVGSFDVAYERIDPNYKTMGALFFNNDLQNLTIGTKLKFFQSRLILVSRGGWQSNNLDGSQANDYGRFVGSVNTNFRATEKLILNAMYSSFNNVNRRSIINDPQSPILFNELILANTNASAGFNYILAKSNNRQTMLQGNYNYAQGNTIENDVVNADQGTSSRNIFITYIYSMLDLGWTFGVNSAMQRNVFGTSTTQFINGGVLVGKKLWNDKFNLNLTTNLAFTTQFLESNPVSDGQLSNIMFSAGWKLADKSTLTIYTGYIHNQVGNILSGQSNFSEFRSSLNYQYRFLTQRKK